jgi:hypothetical protein
MSQNYIGEIRPPRALWPMKNSQEIPEEAYLKEYAKWRLDPFSFGAQSPLK